MKGIYIVLFFWLVIGTSCDPCENCGEPLLFEPTIAITFINRDTLAKLDTAKSFFTDSLNKVEVIESAVDDELDSLETRLQAVNDSIENGDNSFVGERDELEDLIAIYLDSLVAYSDQIDDLDSILDNLTNGIRDVNNGLLKVDTLFVNGQFLTYEDSMEVYDVPLIMDPINPFTQFEVIIKDFRGEMAFSYTLEESVDATREIKLRALNIELTNTFGFDSVGQLECVNNRCRDSETTLHLYYK